MLTDAHQLERRAAILRILRSGLVGKQADLVRLLKKEGHAVTPDEVSRANGDFGTLTQFVRELRSAGPSITVLRTTIGAAQSVAVAIDKAQWPEVAGTISGDDTIFIATANARGQQELLGRLRTLFRV